MSSNLLSFGLFNTEITEIKNGWLLTERSIPILGVSYPTTTYFSTLAKLSRHLMNREKQAKKRKKQSEKKQNKNKVRGGTRK